MGNTINRDSYDYDYNEYGGKGCMCGKRYWSCKCSDNSDNYDTQTQTNYKHIKGFID